MSDVLSCLSPVRIADILSASVRSTLKLHQRIAAVCSRSALRRTGCPDPIFPTHYPTLLALCQRPLLFAVVKSVQVINSSYFHGSFLRVTMDVLAEQIAF